MESFNFFFGFYGLLLGFSVAVVTRGLATIASQRGLMGAAVPSLLGLFMLVDLVGMWVLAWDFRELLGVNYPSLFAAMGIAIIYYFAATIAFPDPLPEGDGLMERYWSNKRLIIGAILVTGVCTVLLSLTAAPELIRNRAWLLAQAFFWTPLVALLFTRSRHVDAALWLILTLAYLGEAIFELLSTGIKAS